MTWAVEVAVPEVSDGDWSTLDSALQRMPGAILIRDQVSPVLVMPVSALTSAHAERAAARVLSRLGVGTKSVNALETSEL